MIAASSSNVAPSAVPDPAVVSRHSIVRPGTAASASAMPSALRAIPASRSSMKLPGCETR
jgi:hypothetical protein